MNGIVLYLLDENYMLIEFYSEVIVDDMFDDKCTRFDDILQILLVQGVSLLDICEML